MDPSLRFAEEDAAKKKKKDSKKDKKDKGYVIFEQDSEEEGLVEESKNPFKLKKHSKPSFKFPKKEKPSKVKDEKKRDDEKKKDEKKKEEKSKFKKDKGNDVEESPVITDKDVLPIFGVALSTVLERNPCHDGIELPAVFRECIDYIEHHGLTCEGIYRVSGVKSKVQILKDMYNQRVPVSLKEFEPSVVASLLKQFLRELPQPILSEEMVAKFESAIANVKEKDRLLQELSVLLHQLPTPNRLLLSWTIVHMSHVIQCHKDNKMSLQNVSIVFSPTLRISHRLLNVLFTFCNHLFADVIIKDYVPPLRPVSSCWSIDLPDSPYRLEEELSKQESLLDQLHRELMEVKDKDKEEQLWEVQRVVTGLKRKIKLVKKAQSSPAFRHTLEQSHFKSSSAVDASKTDSSQTATSGSLPRKKRAPHPPHPPHPPNLPQLSKTPTQAPHTPSNEGPDFGDIGTDSGAAKQSRHRRADSQTIMGSMVLTVDKYDATPTKPAITMAKPPRKNLGKSPLAATTAQDKHEGGKETAQEEAEGGVEAGDQATLAEAVVIKEDIDQRVFFQDSDDEDERTLGKPRTILVHHEPLKDKSADDVIQVEARVEEIAAGETPMYAEGVGGCGPEYESGVVILVNQVPASDSLSPQISSHLDSSIESPMVVPPSSKHSDSRDPRAPALTGSKPVEGLAVTPEALYQALQQLHVENEEEEQEEQQGGEKEEEGKKVSQQLVDLNEQLMSEFVQDFGIEKSESLDQDGEYQELLYEYAVLMLEEEELIANASELKQKIENERSEIERLEEEITEVEIMREELYSEEQDNSDNDSADSTDEEEFANILQLITRENKKLVADNQDLCQKIHQESQACLQVKIKIKIIQQKQAESSHDQLDLLL